MITILRTGFFLVIAITAGCGSGAIDITGKVTYKDKPIVYGTVILVDSSSLPRSGVLQPDGSFKIVGIMPGTAKVAVSSPSPPGSEQPKAKKNFGRDADDDDKPPPPSVPPASPEVIAGWVALPEKYGDPAKSEMTVEVKLASPLTIDLK
jgi:hypothetical protein